MPKAATAPEPEYELKHRITGAIILVSVAVLIIPLLLSEPGVEANTDGGDGATTDTTFRSRIVPLDISNVNRPVGDSGGNDLPLATLDSAKPALLDLTNSGQGAAPETASPQAAPEQNTALVMTREPAAKEAKDTAPDKPASQPAEQQPTQQVRAPQNLPEEQGNPDGWVVRVGTFSKQANVDSVSSLLTNSGFKPRTTPVSTSLGESTRVWLGPYAKRETADKISNRLKSLIGEKGYVTKSSS